MRMLSITDGTAKVRLGKTAIYDLINHGEPPFPAAVKLGRASRWVASGVDEWLAEQTRKSREAA